MGARELLRVECVDLDNAALNIHTYECGIGKPFNVVCLEHASGTTICSWKGSSACLAPASASYNLLDPFRLLPGDGGGGDFADSQSSTLRVILCHSNLVSWFRATENDRNIWL